MIERISGSLLDPESLYLRDDALFHSPELRGLNLVMGFTGFADAGHVVKQITAELLDTLDAEMVAEFDADQLIDYRTRRPQISFVEDHLQDYQAPKLALYRLVDGLGSPFLLLAGFEPDLQWERFARAVVGIVEELDVNLVTWIHSIPMPVPHTRPVGVTVHGNRPELIEGISVWKPTVEVPAAVGPHPGAAADGSRAQRRRLCYACSALPGRGRIPHRRRRRAGIPRARPPR